MLATNLGGPIKCCRAVSKVMLRQRGGTSGTCCHTGAVGGRLLLLGAWVRGVPVELTCGGVASLPLVGAWCVLVAVVVPRCHCEHRQRGWNGGE